MFCSVHARNVNCLLLGLGFCNYKSSFFFFQHKLRFQGLERTSTNYSIVNIRVRKELGSHLIYLHSRNEETEENGGKNLGQMSHNKLVKTRTKI